MNSMNFNDMICFKRDVVKVMKIISNRLNLNGEVPLEC